MDCRWCKASGGECGCGYGYCAHCGGSGQQTEPPFGHLDRSCVDSAVVHYWAEVYHDTSNLELKSFVDSVAIAVCGNPLADEDTQTLVDYWNEPYRDENLGDWITRIGMRALTKYKQIN